MKITWLGHSCFKIETKNETIILDPYEDGYVDGLKPLRDHANLVLCSHEHGDHNARNVITLDPKPIQCSITTLSTFHDDQQGALRGPNTIHIIDDGNYKVAHLGDLGCSLTEEESKLLHNMDVVLIPVGGHYTIDAKQARDIISQIHPKITIPMHYRSDDFGFSVLQTVDQFTQCFDHVTTLPTNSLDVEENLDKEIVVLSLKK